MAESALAVKCMIALVLITAGVGKIQHWAEFLGVVANYRLLPGSLVKAVGYALPPVEIALGVSLFIPPLSPWTSLCVGALLIAFAAAMAINIARGRRHIDCGCFQSALKQSLSWTLVVRNVVLTFLIVISGLMPETLLRAASAVEAVATGTILFIVLQTLNLLWSIVPHWQRSADSAPEVAP